MNILTYLNYIRPAVPMSAEGKKDDKGACIPMSNGEIRRHLKNKAVLINGETDWTPEEEIPDYVWQLVFFPSSKSKDGKFHVRLRLFNRNYHGNEIIFRKQSIRTANSNRVLVQ